MLDLLLQVLGEGRLTDAQGQTADFCNCIIILTSNLGAGAGSRSVGFAATEEIPGGEHYIEAARKHFRPEFFNRLDRIVPFHELRKGDIVYLARTMAERALNRQGLQDRHVDVRLEDDVVKALADRGFDLAFGARALRRAVETYLVEPLAEKLLGMPWDRAARFQVTVDPEGRLQFHLHTVKQVDVRLPFPVEVPDEVLWEDLSRAHAVLDAATDRLDAWEFDEPSDDVGPMKAWYYHLRGEISRLRFGLERCEDFLEGEEKARRHAMAARSSNPHPPRRRDVLHVLPEEVLVTLLDDLMAERLASHAIEDVLGKARPMDEIRGRILRLLWRTRYLYSVCEPDFVEPQEWVLRLDSPIGYPVMYSHRPCWAQHAFGDYGEIDPDIDRAKVTAHGASDLIRSQSGTFARISPRGLSSISTHVSSWEGPMLQADPSIIEKLELDAMLVDLRTGLVAHKYSLDDGVMDFAYVYGLPIEEVENA